MRKFTRFFALGVVFVLLMATACKKKVQPSFAETLREANHVTDYDADIKLTFDMNRNDQTILGFIGKGTAEASYSVRGNDNNRKINPTG